MKFVDEVSINIKAGAGGNGHLSFLHSRSKPLLGPDGGNGGKGGGIYFRGSSHLNSLYRFSTRKNWFAADGENGGSGLKTGRSGDNLYIDIPLGTIIYMTSGSGVEVPTSEIMEEQQLFLAAEGGQGGQGNNAFASSVNRTPRYAQRGVATRILQVRLELVAIADAGLLGLPNAGKSTLLNALSNANSHSGDYAFTTLNPQLGVVRKSKLKKKLVLADLPGIIAGAAENKGLGLRFLRHIKRCKVLIFVIDSASEQPLKDLQTLREELNAVSCEKLEKEQLVVWNKTDLLPAGNLAQLKQKVQQLKRVSSFFVSALQNKNLEALVTAADRITEYSEGGCAVSLGNFSYKNYDFTGDPPGLELRKLKNHYWKISGPYIERIIQRSRTSLLREEISQALDIESTRTFLSKTGVKSGDTLLINNEEYFWS